MNYTGKLLIAPPSIKGSFWQKSVIYITENHHRGSLGVVLNKSSKSTISDFSKQCGIDCNIEGMVYVGGPVNTKALTILHSSEWSCQNTMKINDMFSLSSHNQLLQQLTIGDKPKFWRMFLGLCAWNPEQLENEIRGSHPYHHNSSWLTATPTYQSVFATDGNEQWTSGIEMSSHEFVQSILD